MAIDEETDDEISTVSMKVLLGAGNARTYIDKALDSLAEQDFEAADGYLESAEEQILLAHEAQTSMIQRQASGERFDYSILFVHAQDTLMTISAELHMTKKMLPIVRALATAPRNVAGV